MSSYSMARSNGEAEFEIRYVKDGKDMTWTGTGFAGIKYDAEYDEISADMCSRPIKTSQTITVTLDNVQNLKGTARIRREVEKIKTSREVKVNDFTFGAVSAARKKVGAPKEATFELTTRDSKDYSLRDEKVVVFTWEEVL